jgi:hypothetical protein
MAARRKTTLVLAPLVASLIAAAPAPGAADRRDFVSKVDPICKAERAKASKLLNRAKPRNRSRANAYAEIARRGRAAIARIYRIGPPPTAGQWVLWDRWTQKLQLENTLTDDVAAALRSGKPRRAQKLYRQAADADRRAEKIVRGYGFRYCDDSSVGSP